MAADRHADRYALAQRIIALLEDELAAEGYELVDVRILMGGGRQQVRITLDTPAGIDLDACARASRTVNALLDEADLFAHPYVVEVSSPGVRRPLRTRTHFAAAQGQDVELKLRRGDKTVRERGRLLDLVGDELILRPAAARQESAPEAAVEPDEFRVPLDAVLEANLDAEFDAQALIGADRRRRKEEKRRRRAERNRRPRRQGDDDGAAN